MQEWDAMVDTFWLMQGLDLILQLLAEDEKVTLAPNSGVVAGLFPDSEDPKMPPPGPPDGNKTAPASTKKGKKASSSAKDVDNKNDVDEIAELFARHSKFIKQSGALRVSDLVAPLRKVGKRNTHVAYYLWGSHLPDRLANLTTRRAITIGKTHDRAAFERIPSTTSGRASKRHSSVVGRHLLIPAATENPFGVN